RFPGRDLDGLMRLMWQRHGSGERYEAGEPYTVADIERALADYTGDAAFAGDFFDRFVRGSDAPDYASLLRHAGVSVQQPNLGRASIGQVQVRADEDGALVASPPAAGSPLHDAGIGSGDR